MYKYFIPFAFIKSEYNPTFTIRNSMPNINQISVLADADAIMKVNDYYYACTTRNVTI